MDFRELIFNFFRKRIMIYNLYMYKVIIRLNDDYKRFYLKF